MSTIEELLSINTQYHSQRTNYLVHSIVNNLHQMKAHNSFVVNEESNRFVQNLQNKITE